MLWTDSLCTICGRESCHEASDHQRTILSQVTQLMSQRRDHNDTNDLTDQLCDRVEAYYLGLRQEVIESLHRDKRTVLAIIRQMEYGTIVVQPRVSAQLVGELACGDSSSLPTKRMLPILAALNNPVTNQPQTNTFDHMRQIIENQININSISSFRTLIQSKLIFPLIKQEKAKSILLKSKISFREDLNPEESTFQEPLVQVQIKSRVITHNTKEADLNNIALTDNDMVRSMNDLKQMKALIKLEIRNNCITSLTCKLIAFNLTHLTKLDIRGNKVKDEGVIIICRNLKKLKQLMACENSLTDESTTYIFDYLKDLTMIYLSNNQISYAGVQTIMKLEKLRVVDIKGNLLSEEEGQGMRARFLGYMAV